MIYVMDFYCIIIVQCTYYRTVPTVKFLPIILINDFYKN